MARRLCSKSGYLEDENLACKRVLNGSLLPSRRLGGSLVWTMPPQSSSMAVQSFQPWHDHAQTIKFAIQLCFCRTEMLWCSGCSRALWSRDTSQRRHSTRPFLHARVAPPCQINAQTMALQHSIATLYYRNVEGEFQFRAKNAYPKPAQYAGWKEQIHLYGGVPAMETRYPTTNPTPFLLNTCTASHAVFKSLALPEKTS